MINCKGKVQTPKGTYRFLEKDEKILKTDLVRNLYSLCCEYDPPNAMKEMNWGLASDRISGWIGKTLREFENFDDTFLRDSIEIMRAVR